MLRQILEKCSQRVVLRRQLPKAYGGSHLYVTPGAALRYWHPNLRSVDKTLLDLALDFVRPGHVVWDVGANVGLFAFAAAGLSGPKGKIYAIEPDAVLVSLLRRSASIPNPSAAAVTVLPLAVAESVGLKSFHIAARGRAANHLNGFGLSQAGGTRETQTIMSVSLDWLLTELPPPNVIKIDCEGAESIILSAGNRVLEEIRPTIICEVSTENQATVTSQFYRTRYILFDGQTDKKSRKPVGVAPWSTIALPCERLNG